MQVPRPALHLGIGGADSGMRAEIVSEGEMPVRLGRAHGEEMELRHPAIPDLLTVALPFRWASGERPGPRRPPPDVGAHTEEVLREAGLDAAGIAALRASGALGDGAGG